ncbi:MAG: hypothetical protein AAFY02_12470 [Pseudomonadota bacterium]
MSLCDQDWETLNAYADDELGRQERKLLQRRLRKEPALAEALAEISQLKASLARLHPRPAEAPARKSAGVFVRNIPAIAASLLLALGLGFGWVYSQSEGAQGDQATGSALLSTTEARIDVASSHALGSLEAPDLSASNLTLVEMAVRLEAPKPVVVMSFRGPRGCAVTLTARPVGSATGDKVPGSLFAAWTTQRAAFTFTAEGMDPHRFAAAARYAEAQTRAADDQEALRVALVERTATAVPCA